MSTLEKVKQFHIAFERPIYERPHIDDYEVNKLRVKLLREEVNELEEALAEGNQEKALDALTDIQYILDGSYLSLGFYMAKEYSFSIVHDANMRKLDSYGKPIIREDGKIVKPKGWIPPDLSNTVFLLNNLAFKELQKL